MILDLTQIKNILLDNPNRAIVNRGCEYNKRLRMHMYGEDLDNHLEQIEGYEKDALKKLRVKYTKSNKDLFSRLGRPIDKVFSARGGSIYYNLSEAQDKLARQLSQDVRNGQSIRKWVESYWKPHTLDDPFGIIFLEMLPMQEAILAKKSGKSFVYPTYVSITSVYDYLPKGNKLEYVVFNVTKAEKKAAGLDEKDTIYRVVDDAFDYYVKRQDKEITVLQELTLKNFFGEVPAMINSDIVDPNREYCYLSLYDEVMELAAQFLLKGSIKVTHDFLHGFPKYYEYADDCNSCKGTGWNGGVVCTDCKGTGKTAMTKVSDVKLLPYPKKEAGQEDIVVTPDVAGYISPDKVFHEIATADIQLLEDLMNVTVWGTQSRVRTQGMSISGDATAKTATEVMDEIKPQADRLHPISEMAELRHKFILDNVIRLQVMMTYGGSSVNYGRRYMIEGPDVIWEKYSSARKDGASQEVLNDLLTEYYEAKYATDPVKLTILVKLKDVEPFIHNTIEEIKDWPVSPFEKLRKTNFLDWRTTKTEADLIVSTVDQLKQDLTNFVITKSQQDDLNKDSTPLAVKLGVGGTQALQLFVADPGIDMQSKRNILQILFGVSEADAAKMVVKETPVPGPKPIPLPAA
ncbi:MAG TPA: hypothetical protein VMZ03_03815 [Chitinophagaceae bacterium]|nr:hypothetical protein [Chitinophagaceae bacterium]